MKCHDVKFLRLSYGKYEFFNDENSSFSTQTRKLNNVMSASDLLDMNQEISSFTEESENTEFDWVLDN